MSLRQAIVEKVAKRDKKTETRELVDDWEAKIAAKQVQFVFPLKSWYRDGKIAAEQARECNIFSHLQLRPFANGA